MNAQKTGSLIVATRKEQDCTQISVISHKWEITWVVWIVYCFYRLYTEYIYKKY